MRILHIINSLESGGAEKLVLDTLPLYNKMGIQVDLLVLNGADYPFMKVLKATECCSIFSLGRGSRYNPIYIFKIITYLKKYDVAHVHLFPAQYWVLLAKLVSGSKIKLVYTEHSTSSRRVRSWFFKCLDPLFYKRYQKIVCITEKVADVVKKHNGLSGSNIEVINNGVLIDIFKSSIPKDKFDFFPNSDANLKIIIQVSSFKVPKDQATLIRALSYLSSDVKLLLVGEGILQQQCKELANELKVEDRVLFLGIRIDVPQLLKMADLVVLSSSYEGFSLAAIEGMASGKPLIASDVESLKSIVKDAGILFKLGDAKALSTHIDELFTNNIYYQDVVSKCQQRAEQYDIKFMVDQHIELYTRLSKQ
jgi:glycosyltransferase involved in cell wall biosynthesis